MNGVLLGDLWEGSGNVDEKELCKHLAGMIVRLDDINGQPHLDENFTNQWEANEIFPVRMVYYVYSPWLNGKDNYDWLMTYLPSDSPKAVCIDIEVKKQDYGPAQYAINVANFASMLTKRYKMVTYTGGWFLPTLAYWPKTPYWWARYPFFTYPKTTEALTWEEMKRKVEILKWVPACSLGEPALWQFTADRYKLPGTASRCLDLNIFPGTVEQLREFVGAPTPPRSWAWSVTDALRDLHYDIPDPKE